MRQAEAPLPAAPWERKPFSGPLFERVARVFAGCPELALYRDGRLAPDAYHAFVERKAPELIAAGVPAGEVHFAKRIPPAPERFVRDALERLARARILPAAAYDAPAGALAAALAARYDHGGLGTYIYPEEGRLLCALADAVRPRNAVFLGSYYGYWAAWAIPSIAARGGRVTLVDPDPRAAAVARRNAARYGGAVRVEVTTGARFLAASAEPIDFVVVDAELPRTHPDPDERGKGVYRSLLRAALPHLAPRAYLVAHNVLLADATGDPQLARVVARNLAELGPFCALVAHEFDAFAELASTEGVGVGVRTR